MDSVLLLLIDISTTEIIEKTLSRNDQLSFRPKLKTTVSLRIMAIPKTPYASRNHFLQDWGYSDIYREANRSFDLTENDFYIEPGLERPITLRYCKLRDHYILPGKKLSSLISSHLLYYRISAIFGIPRGQFLEDLTQLSAWRVKLYHLTDTVSTLAIVDIEGEIYLSFHGSEEARDSMVDLLNFLVRSEIPHPSIPFLAGREIAMLGTK